MKCGRITQKLHTERDDHGRRKVRERRKCWNLGYRYVCVGNEKLE